MRGSSAPEGNGAVPTLAPFGCRSDEPSVVWATALAGHVRSRHEVEQTSCICGETDIKLAKRIGLTPEVAGADDQAAMAAAAALLEEWEDASEPDRRLQDFVTDLAEVGRGAEEDGWVSVWPLEVGDGGVSVPTTYADVEGNLLALLRLAAGQGLVLVDLSGERVFWPGLGHPVGVAGGDGTRLGAVTRERLEFLVAQPPSQDPWLILERGSNRYVQGTAARHPRTASGPLADGRARWPRRAVGWSVSRRR